MRLQVKHSLLFPFRRPGKQSGYGLVLLMVFFITTIITMCLMRMAVDITMPDTLQAYQDQFDANTMATVAFHTVQNDILYKLIAGTPVNTSYRYPASGTSPIKIPAQDPIDPNDTVGQF